MRSFYFIVIFFLIISKSAIALDDPDLIFYFTFEEISGDFIKDQSGKGHDGKIVGKVKLSDSGKRGKALELDGQSYLDLDGANFPAAHIPRDAITICAWVKCKQGGDQAIFNARASDQTWLIHPELRSENNYRWLLRSDGGVTIFDIRAGSVKWGEWSHYAGVYDGKRGYLYINGVLEGENVGGGKIAKDWGLGARVGRNIDEARPFNGLMDDLCLWKKALTLDEIKKVMEKGAEAVSGGESVLPFGNIVTTWGDLKRF
ncbi:MAG: LamG domain-containing protein [bacterium]